jgi:hypothetical protein
MTKLKVSSWALCAAVAYLPIIALLFLDIHIKDKWLTKLCDHSLEKTMPTEMDILRNIPVEQVWLVTRLTIVAAIPFTSCLIFSGLILTRMR